MELLPHVKGRWARRRETLRLEPWQAFLTCCIFGWLRRADGLRRFRRVFLLIPRKSGKSFMAAGWGLYMFVADDEHGAEVYSGATTEKQAWMVFGAAHAMAKRTPALTQHYGIEVFASNLHVDADGSKFEPIIGKPGDGPSSHCSIHDEYHEHDTDAQVDSMWTGMGARDQPLLVIITTAGDNLAGPCYQAQLDAQAVLEGTVEDNELFACMWGIDPEDDWTSEAALRKANPNYDVSVSGDFLRSQQRQAINTARKQGTFRTKHLNEWVSSRVAYFNTQRWIASAVPSLSLADFRGQPCIAGLDLASKVDIAAKVLLFELERCKNEAAERLRADGYRYVMFGRWYLPEETVLQPDNRHYQGWHRDGWLTVTDGQLIDFTEIKADLLDDVGTFQVENVAYDPHQATQLVNELQAEGVPVIEYRPLVLNFSEPMKTLDGLIRSQAMAHSGDPVMTWMISNVTGKHDAKDNVYPRKEREENKIDGSVALMSALGVMMADRAAAPPSLSQPGAIEAYFG